VQDVHNELAAAEQPVRHELAGPYSDSLLAHGEIMMLKSDWAGYCTSIPRVRMLL
jgi:hypothetical protein